MSMEIYTVPHGTWKRTFSPDLFATIFFTITTDRYVVQMTGGSVIIRNKQTDGVIQRLKGYNYVYTGDVSPDEKTLFALENGKHFYIFSLNNFAQIQRITLPRSYEAIDVYGSFSEDGKRLYVPVYKYVNDRYRYWLCEYETITYTLADMKPIEPSATVLWPHHFTM